MKTIIVTGVSKGLGFALAKEFCMEGHKVYGCSRKLGQAEELLKAFPELFSFQHVDISDHEQVVNWSKSVTGPLDLLINNASIINRVAPCWELSNKEVHKVIAINVLGVFSCIQAFLPAMISQKQGMIVNISSGWGRRAEKGLSPYCASKFAIEGLTQSVAKELPAPLAIISLDPGGGIQTEMLDFCLPEYSKTAPKPEEWAVKACPYILSLTPEQNGASLTCPATNFGS